MTSPSLGLEHGEEARLLGQARDPDRVAWRRCPSRAGRARTRAGSARRGSPSRVCTLCLEVAQVGDGGGGDVGDLVRHRDQRHALALAEHVARLGADGLRGGGARGGRRRARALHAGVHVGLVVVTDVEHVVVALEHPRQARHADVDGAAVAALADDADVARGLWRAARRRCRWRPPARCRTASGSTGSATRSRDRAWRTPPGSRWRWRRSSGRWWRASRRRARSARRAPRRSPGRRGDRR